MNFSDPVMAALIGAGATMLTALVQLRTSWRKELNERERGQPITRKNRRGPVFAVLVLLIGAAVGGFALSQYLLSLRYGDNTELRDELQGKLAELSASAARLEQARLDDRSQVEAAIRHAEAQRAGEQGISASVTLPPCQRTAGNAKRACTEAEAMQVALCASVPAAASVTEVQLFAQWDDAAQPWAQSRAQPELDLGQARFVNPAFEHTDTEATKRVCQRFTHWHGEKTRIARILVKYAL
jgi:outer membrane murein-binding lipoprotein Lpp